MSAETEAHSPPLQRPNSRFSGSASLRSPLSPWYTDMPQQFRVSSSPLGSSQQRSNAVFSNLEEFTPRHSSPVFAARSSRVVSGGPMSPRCAILACRRYQVRPGDDRASLPESQWVSTRHGRPFASTICRGNVTRSPRISGTKSIPNIQMDVSLVNRPLTARRPSLYEQRQQWPMKQGVSAQKFRGVRRDDDSLVTSSNDLSNTDEGFYSHPRMINQEHPGSMAANTTVNQVMETKQGRVLPEHARPLVEAIPQQFVQKLATPSKKRMQGPGSVASTQNSKSLEPDRLGSSQRNGLNSTLNREFPIHESLCMPPQRNAAAPTAASGMYSSLRSTVLHQLQNDERVSNVPPLTAKATAVTTTTTPTKRTTEATTTMTARGVTERKITTKEAIACITPSNNIDRSPFSIEKLNKSQFMVTKSSVLLETGASYVTSRALMRQFVQHWRNRYEENKSAYSEGGYMTVTPGKKLNSRYVVVQKLGWGEFSTVWLAYDTMHMKLSKPNQAFVALKIAKCDSSVAQSTHYEINLLRYIEMRASENVPLTHLVDSFEVNGQYGSHICMVMPLHGSNLLSIIDQMKVKKGIRSPSEIRLVKEIVASVLVGLQDLDKMDVIHTDIKPENILCFSPDQKVLDVIEAFCLRNKERSTMVPYEKVRDDMLRGNQNHLVCLADFGLSVALKSATQEVSQKERYCSFPDNLLGGKKEFPVEKAGVVRNLRGTMIQTREYRAPEIIIGLDFNTRTDLWSVGCMVYELITGHFLMDPKRRTRNERMMDVEHLAMIMQLLGPVPEEIVMLRNAREPQSPPPRYIHRYFDENLRFIYAEKYRFYPKRNLEKELELFLPPAEAEGAAAFIMWCLSSYDPMKRPTAQELLCHAWLSDVTSKQC